ncbi:hypothetical protein DSUL_50436 [Desulfovibrionales bacterium]
MTSYKKNCSTNHRTRRRPRLAAHCTSQVPNNTKYDTIDLKKYFNHALCEIYRPRGNAAVFRVVVIE